MDFSVALSISIGAGIAALCGVLVLRQQSARNGSPAGPLAGRSGPAETEILLADSRVVDMTRAARHLLDFAPGDTPDWAAVRARLEPFFGPLPEELPREAASHAALHHPGCELVLHPDGRNMRLKVEASFLPAGEQLKLLEERDETPRLRRALSLVPCPIWQSDDSRRVTWYNTAYEDACAQVGAQPSGPAPFELAAPDGSDTHSCRAPLGARGDDSEFWYEVRSHRTRDGWMHFATNIDAIIRSEVNQRNFLQTLTRIFAHLPIGLAVFDRDRRLALFNPSLIDLTGLTAEFLSARPDLMSFFDALREGRMMPEPKNYQSWREHLTGVIAAASSDLYVETWELPTGLTYRITGRPHPDAGVAFLFEDISSEVSLTRRFRQELEQLHSVLDCLEDAVAVFSHQGALTFCNGAYSSLWGDDPDTRIADLSVAEAIAHWRAACAPSPIWGELREFVLSLRERATWEAPLDTLDGTPLLCRVAPMPGGATLLRFSPRSAQDAESSVAHG